MINMIVRRYGPQICYHHAEAAEMWLTRYKNDVLTWDSELETRLRNYVDNKFAQFGAKSSYFRTFIMPTGQTIMQFDAAPAPLHVGEEVTVRWIDGNGASKAYSGVVQYITAEIVASEKVVSGQPIPFGNTTELVIIDTAALKPTGAVDSDATSEADSNT